MNKGLSDYLKSIGAKPVDPKVLAEYHRKMREEVIPAIDRDMRAQRRAAHFLRLGIPDPLASVGRNAERQDAEERLGPKDEHAVPSEASADAQTPPPSSNEGKLS